MQTWFSSSLMARRFEAAVAFAYLRKIWIDRLATEGASMRSADSGQSLKGKAMDDNLPEVPTSISDDHPALWKAYLALGGTASNAGPLDERTCRLVHLALAIGQGSEGATHSHARRAMTEGLSAAEIEHVALLGVTTLGWPQAMRGLSWIRDMTRLT
jgi:4-carboxymuconolactone decarboxylase